LGHGLGSARNAELAEDRRDVKLDGVLGDPERTANVFVPGSARELREGFGRLAR